MANRQMAGPAEAPRTRKASGRKATPKSQATRMHILAAAARTISANGYGPTRLADIAQAAELHLTALYYYYDNKEALAGDLLLHTSARNSEALADALARLPERASQRRRVETAVHAYLAAVLRQDDFMRAYRAIVSEVSEATREPVLEIHRRDGELWRRLIAEAVQAGAIRKDVDATMARMALLGAMNWSVEWHDAGRGSPERYAKALCALLFEGIGAPAAES